MDYQGQNGINPNMTPMGPNVETSVNSVPETPYMPEHDIQGIGAIGSSAAKEEIEQLMSGDLGGEENPGPEFMDRDMPPMSPADMANDQIEVPTAKSAEKTDHDLAVKEMFDGNNLSSSAAEKVDAITDKAGKDPAGANDDAFAMSNEMIKEVRGYGIGETA